MNLRKTSAAAQQKEADKAHLDKLDHQPALGPDAAKAVRQKLAGKSTWSTCRDN